MTHNEAYKISEEAIACFNRATVILGEMREAAPWTPEYAEAKLEADRLIARGQMLHERYRAWVAAQDGVTVATAAARQGAEDLGGHIVANWSQFDAEDTLEAQAKFDADLIFDAKDRAAHPGEYSDRG